MTSKQPCPKCGNDEHYVITKHRTGRFTSGHVLKAVECANCGKKTKV